MSKAQGMCHKYGMTHNRTKCIDNLYANVFFTCKIGGQKYIIILRYIEVSCFF